MAKEEVVTEAVAETTVAEEKAVGFEKGTKFFRSNVSGLIISTGEETSVRFQPYYEKYQGDDVRVGYLATADKRALEVLATDGTVEEISEKDFVKATQSKESRVAGLPVA